MSLFKGGLFGNKNAQPEEPIVINEQMLVDDLEAKIFNQIVEIFNFSMDNATFQMPETGPELDSSLQFLKESTEKELKGPLISLAHRIDNGMKIVSEYKDELSQSKQDLGGSYHNNRTPTPFISRFVADLKTQFYELDQSIKTVESTLSSNVSNEDLYQEMFPEVSLAEALQKEHESINRISSKVSVLKQHFDELNEVYQEKSHFADASAEKEDEHVDDTTEENKPFETTFDTAGKIETKYQQYLSENKNKQRNRIEKNDLFGSDPAVLAAQPAAKSGFGFGVRSNAQKAAPAAGAKPTPTTPGPGGKT